MPDHPIMKSMASSSSTKTKLRYKYFGYPISREWFLTYGVKNGLVPNLDPATRDEDDMPIEEIDEVGSIISAALMRIRSTAGLLFTSKIGTVMSYENFPEYCIVLATNNSHDKLPLPPPEKYAKLKEILGTTKDPQWYLAAS